MPPQSSSHDTVAAPVLKIATAWLAAIGVSSWSEMAAMLAAVYSLLLIFEWLWKKFLRPLLEAYGVLERRKRRKDDV